MGGSDFEVAPCMLAAFKNLNYQVYEKMLVNKRHFFVDVPSLAGRVQQLLPIKHKTANYYYSLVFGQRTGLHVTISI